MACIFVFYLMQLFAAHFVHWFYTYLYAVCLKSNYVAIIPIFLCFNERYNQWNKIHNLLFVMAVSFMLSSDSVHVIFMTRESMVHVVCIQMYISFHGLALILEHLSYLYFCYSDTEMQCNSNSLSRTLIQEGGWICVRCSAEAHKCQ